MTVVIPFVESLHHFAHQSLTCFELQVVMVTDDEGDLRFIYRTIDANQVKETFISFGMLRSLLISNIATSSLATCRAFTIFLLHIRDGRCDLVSLSLPMQH